MPFEIKLTLDFFRQLASYTSLGGTVRNCQGGETPWGSWLSAEETGFISEQGTLHGFLFDVPGFPLMDDEDTELDLTLAANLPKPGKSNGVPIRSAGRFSHEGASVDPETGIVYETEDSGRSAIYRYIEPGAGGPNWRANHGNGVCASFKTPMCALQVLCCGRYI